LEIFHKINFGYSNNWNYQKVGTALVTGGDVALATTSGDITLDSATNNFGGSFGASGENIYPLSKLCS
jgi:hypothetical protein